MKTTIEKKLNDYPQEDHLTELEKHIVIDTTYIIHSQF